MQEHTSIAKSGQEHTSIAKSMQEHTSIAKSGQSTCQIRAINMPNQHQCASVFPYYYSQTSIPWYICNHSPSSHLPTCHISGTHSQLFILLHFLFFQAILFGQGYITKVADTIQHSQLSSSLHFPFSRLPSKPGLHQESHSYNSSFSQLFFPFLFQFHLCHLFRPRLHLESHLPFGSSQLNLYLTWIILCLSNLEILL